jgi:hypothetical protein
MAYRGNIEVVCDYCGKAEIISFQERRDLPEGWTSRLLTAGDGQQFCCTDHAIRFERAFRRRSEVFYDWEERWCIENPVSAYYTEAEGDMGGEDAEV